MEHITFDGAGSLRIRKPEQLKSELSRSFGKPPPEDGRVKFLDIIIIYPFDVQGEAIVLHRSTGLEDHEKSQQLMLRKTRVTRVLRNIFDYL